MAAKKGSKTGSGGEAPFDLSKFVTPGLDPAHDGAVHITGFLATQDGSTRRLYPSLEDRSHYIEFDAKDVRTVVKHEPTTCVTISLAPDAEVRTVHGENTGPARFLDGPIRQASMGDASEHAALCYPNTKTSACYPNTKTSLCYPNTKI